MPKKMLAKRARFAPVAPHARSRGTPDSPADLTSHNAELRNARNAREALLKKYTALYDFSPIGYFSLTVRGKVRLVNLTGSGLIGVPRARLLNRSLVSYVAPESRRAFRKFLRQVFSSQAKQSCDVVLLTAGRVPRMVNVEAESSPGLRECRVVMTDISARHEAEAKLRASEIRYRRLFEAAHDGVLLVDPHTRRITDANPYMGKLLGCPAPELVGKTLLETSLVKDQRAHDAMFRQLRQHREIRYEDLQLPSASGRHHDVEIVANLYQENDHAVIQCNIRDITERKRIEAFQQRAGKLTVANREANKEIARRRLVELALIKSEEAQGALLREARELQAQLRNLTRKMITIQEDERRAISRELHDDVLQTLVGINVELGLLTRDSPDPRTLQRKIAHAQRIVTDSISEVHRFARDLRPAVLDDFGLVPALEAYCERLSQRTKLKIRLTAFETIADLDVGRQTVLFRVAQEALTNVTRHAHASRVTIRLSKVANFVRMEINDNGRSFSVEQILQKKHPQRLGLIGMRERIEMVGGRMTLQSSVGRGTTVTAEIPCQPPLPHEIPKTRSRPSG